VFTWKQYCAVSPSTAAVFDVIQKLKAISNLPSQQFSKRGKHVSACLGMPANAFVHHLAYPISLVLCNSKCNLVAQQRTCVVLETIPCCPGLLHQGTQPESKHVAFFALHVTRNKSGAPSMTYYYLYALSPIRLFWPLLQVCSTLHP